MTGKCTALEAANYLIFLMNDSFDDLSNMKLNKLLYYAQGQYLLQKGEVLFDDDIEAWEHGPIIDKVYQKYKNSGDASISDYDTYMARQMPEDCADVLMKVAREYGRYTASALRNKTHVPNGPWDRVYVEGKNHTVIPVSYIKEYFEKNEKEIAEVEIPLSNEDFIGRRDENGYLVLPKEWNDEEI